MSPSWTLTYWIGRPCGCTANYSMSNEWGQTKALRRAYLLARLRQCARDSDSMRSSQNLLDC